MFKFKEEAEGRNKEENVNIAKGLILNLTDLVEELKHMEVGINSKEASNDNYDLILISEFDSIKDLKTYAVHKDHMKVIKFMKEVVETRTCVDYEI
jgi:hypothetical protein